MHYANGTIAGLALKEHLPLLDRTHDWLVGIAQGIKELNHQNQLSTP